MNDLDSNGIQHTIDGLKILGFNPTYTRESLVKLEVLLDMLFPSKIVTKPLSTIPFGLYLGETIIRGNKGAIWKFEQNLYESKVRVEQGDYSGEAKPFVRVFNFVEDNEYNLTTLYDMFKLNVKELEEMAKTVGNKNWTRKGNIQYRVRDASKMGKW